MFIYICTHVNIYAHIHIHIYTYMHIYIYIYICMCMCIYIHTHIHIHIHVHIHIHIQLYIHIYIYIYIYMRACDLLQAGGPLGVQRPAALAGPAGGGSLVCLCFCLSCLFVWFILFVCLFVYVCLSLAGGGSLCVFLPTLAGPHGTRRRGYIFNLRQFKHKFNKLLQFNTCLSCFFVLKQNMYESSYV